MNKTGVVILANKNETEILCGKCGGKMYEELLNIKCHNCNMYINGKYLKNFFSEKYRDKIIKIEVNDENSAKIYFAK